MSSKGDLDFYIVKLCSGKTAFEALPKRGMRFRFNSLAEKLRENGYSAEVYGSLLIVKRNFETTIFPSGRLLIKCNDEQEARAEAARIGYLILELGGGNNKVQK
ncbi:MAG: hypothetical protein QXU48_04330 [Thermoplasmata archaeon]